MVGERISFVEGGAGRLRVSEGGEGGVPVVLVHGLASELETWRPVLDRLRGSRRAIAYDQRGHGQSDPAGEYSIAALAGDLDRVVEQLGLPQFWLAGHSFSGTVVSAYAAEHPEKVAGVVYVDAVGDASDSAPEMKEYYRQHVARMDLKAFATLRRDMGDFDGLSTAAKYGGPRFAIEAEGEDNPFRASHLP